MVRTLVVLRYDPPLITFCLHGADASDESILPEFVTIPYPQLLPLSRDSLLSDWAAPPSPEPCRVAHLAAQVAQLPAISHRAPASAANLISTGLNTTLTLPDLEWSIDQNYPFSPMDVT